MTVARSSSRRSTGDDTWRAMKVAPRPAEQMRNEWDEVATHRLEQIEHGRDVSYLYVLVPQILALMPPLDARSVLDVGCGTGHLARKLAENAAKVVGIDPSTISIKLAEQHSGDAPNLQFEAVSAEEYARTGPGTFDVVVANMVLENVGNLDAFLQAVRTLMDERGAFVLAIPHPCNWPRYWGYESADWFSYREEIWITAPFKTSLTLSPNLVTTHLHRPLERYVAALSAAGFSIQQLVEPMPNASVEAKYPAKWEYPRFLLLRCGVTPAPPTRTTRTRRARPVPTW